MRHTSVRIVRFRPPMNRWVKLQTETHEVGIETYTIFTRITNANMVVEYITSWDPIFGPSIITHYL